MTLICVPIMVEEEASALRDARLAAEFGADLVEYRIDAFFSGAGGETGEREVLAVLGLVRESPLACIVTCRLSGSEGGHYDGPEDARVSLFERLGAAVSPNEHPPRYIDVELAAYTRSANVRQKVNLAVEHPTQVRDLKTSLILSSHDFDGRPADLLRRLARMREQAAASILKIAYRARSLRDNLELFDLMRESDRPMIALGMGEFGLMSRVLSPKFGGFLTFASLRPGSATAPGQPTVQELLDRYRFRSIKPTTRVYGVIGWPVSHSISPDVHNAGFEAIGEWSERDEDGVDVPGTRAGGIYLPMPIPPEYEHFKATLSALIDDPHLGFSGCSVTIPHKEHLVRFARESIGVDDTTWHTGDTDDEYADSGARLWAFDAVSRMCGAANTLAIRRDQDGRIRHFLVVNTDAGAAAEALHVHFGSVGTGDREIAIIGAGGVARSIAAVLAGAWPVTLYNRTLERAERCADELSRALARRGDGDAARVPIRAGTLNSLVHTRPAAIINCTPLGMKDGPAPGSTPVTHEALAAIRRECLSSAGGAAPIIMDTVYNPIETPLLRVARNEGLETIDGLTMFVRQAERQSEIWTHERTRGLFRSVAERVLSPRT
ncbi:MAG: type I 3-dehydroquinate dehydratase [Phycisphaerales bacterium]